jgi:hypothetical protein
MPRTTLGIVSILHAKSICGDSNLVRQKQSRYSTIEPTHSKVLIGVIREILVCWEILLSSDSSKACLFLLIKNFIVNRSDVFFEESLGSNISSKISQGITSK